MKRSAWLGMVALVAGLASGCVERRFVIATDQGPALVYRNGTPIGTAPVDDHFVYYGKYQFTVVKDGFETLQAVQNVDAPWYEIPPLDFVAENLWPFKIRDVRVFTFHLQPLLPVRQDDLLNRATELRGQGQALAPLPPDGKAPPVPATPPGPVAPLGTPGTPAPPVFPSGPAPAPTPP
jgi:hypothetical protein